MFSWIILFLLASVLAAPALVLIASFRNGIVHALWWFLAILWMPAKVLGAGFARVARALVPHLQDATDSLSASKGDRTWSGWAFIGPVAYALVAAFFVAADLLLAVLVQSALTGVDPPGWAQGNVSVLGGFIWVAVAVFWGFLWLDLHSGAPFGPWSTMSRQRLRLLEVVASVATLLALVLTTTSYAWREAQVQFPPNAASAGARGWAPVVMLGLLGLLAAGAALLTGWAFVDSIAVAIIGFLAAVLVLVVTWETGLRVSLAVLDATHGTLVSVYDVPAKEGRKIYNWVCRFDVLRNKLRLEPLVFDERPRITADW